MQNSAATESQQSLPLHRVLEDEYMNLHGPLPEGYPWSFTQSEIIDPLSLILRIELDKSKPSANLHEQLKKFIKASSQETWELLESGKLLGDFDRAFLNAQNVQQTSLHSEEHSGYLRQALVELLNSKLEDETFTGLFDKPQIDEARRVASHYLPNNNLAFVNRILLEKAFETEASQLQLLKKKKLQNEAGELTDVLAGNNSNGEDPEKIARQKWFEKQCLSKIYSLIHEQKPSALCLSGGGIRSATFNLGILQGLARKNLVKEFSYLSTVSGGGYIGSWLTAWIHRHECGVEGVTQELSDRPASALEPDPPQISHLRTYSNYLSPQTGLLSADTWTLAATVLRNLFLNWLVFIPLLLAVLMLPRIYVAAIRHLPTNHPAGDLWEPWSLAIGMILALLGVCYVGKYLPSKDDKQSSQRNFLWRCLLPIVLSAIAINFFWARFRDEVPWPGWETYLHVNPLDREKVLIGFMVLVTLLILVGWAFYAFSRRNVITRYIEDSRRLYNKNVTFKVISLTVLSIVIIVIAGCTTGYLLWKLSYIESANPISHTRTYVIFGVPFLMALLMLAATLLIGLTSRFNSDEEQEWFARFSGWILIFIVGWIVVCGLVLSSADIADNEEWITGEWITGKRILPPWMIAVAAVVGILSGIMTLVGGFSAKTQVYIQSDNRGPIRREGKKGMASVVLKRLTSLAAPIFLVFLIIVFSILTNTLLQKFSPVVGGVLKNVGVEYRQVDFPDIPKWRLTDFLIDPAKYNNVRPDDKKIYHRDIIYHSGLRLLVLTIILLGLFGWIMGLLIDTGKFSIHSMYANRLKRAYLGASKKKRRPNWFTNFDSADDLPIHELRPAIFDEKSFTDLPGLIDDLNNEHDQLSDDLRRNLSPTTRALMEKYQATSDPSDELLRTLAQDLNKILDGDCIYVKKRHEDPKKKITLQMMKQGLQGEGRVLLNRLYLEEAYPDRIKRVYEDLRDKRLSRPLPVINITLNLMKGDRLAWQERKAETFTVSPLHSGNQLLGYRRSRYYGGESGIPLGLAFTISGAAASPNMGYMISSPLVSFLMAMFNVRLGWWLGNPGPAGNRTFKRDVPHFAVGPIVAEALSMADDKRPYVYLSDGGHFENLGLYEMVLRRCHLIVVSDASTDPDYKFDSLGMALRKIRIDLGIPIEFNQDFNIYTQYPSKDSKYASVGIIRYSCVDDECTDGVLIYIKASLSQTNEPRDVLHYHLENESFPQEFIGDQWFSESQFESYRVLGSHIVDEICKNREKVNFNLATFEKQIREYTGQPAAKLQPCQQTDSEH
jgi:hypothetical protein